MPRPWITTGFVPATKGPIATTERFAGWLIQHRFGRTELPVPTDSRVIAAVVDLESSEIVPLHTGPDTDDDPKPSGRIVVHN